MMCQHTHWEKVERKDTSPLRGYGVELRCLGCSARKFVETGCYPVKSERQKRISQGLRLSHARKRGSR